MSEVIDFASERKERSNEASTWTVIDALEHALELVKSGEVPADRVYVAFSYPDPDNKDMMLRYNVICMKTNLEVMGLLQQHIVDIATGTI